MKLIIKKLIIYTVIVVMNSAIFQSVSYAGVIDTNTVMNAEMRSVALDNANRFLVQDQVGEALQALGVSPATVMNRLAALSDAELLELSESIEKAPAGAGALEVIGIVFLVLMILEIVGVTDIFKKL